MTDRYSAIVVTWNAESTIQECLASLRREGGADLETLIVDNASTDGTCLAVLAADPRAKLIRNDENLGFARAVNRGLGRAIGERILLLNPDAVLLPGALDALGPALDADPSIAAAGPALVDGSGRIDYYSARNIPRLRDALFEGLFLTRLLGGIPPFDRYLIGRWDHRTPRRVPCLSGACLLLRRDAIRAVGGMDERFFLFYEDVEWCMRLGRAGYGLQYEPRARVLHIGHASVGCDVFLSYRHAVESSRLFFRECAGRKRSTIDRVWMIVAVWRALVYAVLALVPSERKPYRGRPTAFLRLFAHVVRTAGRR